jgi:hypothetical protein
VDLECPQHVEDMRAVLIRTLVVAALEGVEVERSLKGVIAHKARVEVQLVSPLHCTRTHGEVHREIGANLLSEGCW